MRSENLLRRTATGVALSCVALVACTAAALAVPAIRERLGIAKPSGPAYTVGHRIDVPAPVYASSPQTLLIFTRSGCGACQTARPVLAALVARLARDPTVRVVVVGRQVSEQDERQYARDIGLTGSGFETVDFARLRLRRVPAIVLVDRLGEVRYSLEGALSAADEERLFRAVASFPARR